jgi:hypothetical protein
MIIVTETGVALATLLFFVWAPITSSIKPCQSFDDDKVIASDLSVAVESLYEIDGLRTTETHPRTS